MDRMQGEEMELNYGKNKDDVKEDPEDLGSIVQSLVKAYGGPLGTSCDSFPLIPQLQSWTAAC